MNRAFSEDRYFKVGDLSLFNKASIPLSLDLKLKIINSVRERLLKRFGKIAEGQTMAGLRALALRYDKKFIFAHTSERALLDKVNASRENLRLNKLENLGKEYLRAHIVSDGGKVYSYFDYNAYLQK